MIAITNESGITLELPLGQKLTIEIVSTILNTDDVLRGSYSFPFSFPLTAKNRRFLGGYTLEQISAYEIPVTIYVNGVILEKGIMGYKIGSKQGDGFIKLHMGEVANAIRDTNLRDMFSAPIALAYSLDDLVETMKDLDTAPPATVPCVFPLFSNKIMIEDNTDEPSRSTVSSFNQYVFGAEYGHKFDALGGTEQLIVPMFYLTWIIREISTKLGFRAEGAWIVDAEIECLIIFNTQTLPGYDFSKISYDIIPGLHLPDITVSEFFKRLKAFFGLGIFFDPKNKVVTYESYKHIRQITECQDLSYQQIADSVEWSYPEESGFVIQSGEDSGDQLFKENFYVRKQRIGKGENVISLGISSTYMHTGPSFSMPVVKQLGNLGDPIFVENSNYSLYESGAKPKNPFDFRLLSYRGLQPDASGLLYPFASSVSYNYRSEQVGTLSLLTGEPDDVFKHYQEPYYEMIAKSKRGSIDLLLSTEEINKFNPAVPIALKAYNSIWSKYMVEKLSYELPLKQGKSLAQISFVQFTPAYFKTNKPEDLIYAACWVSMDIENITNRSNPEQPSEIYRTADIVIYVFEDAAGTIPLDIAELTINYKLLSQSFKQRERRGNALQSERISETEEIRSKVISGNRFVIESQVPRMTYRVDPTLTGGIYTHIRELYYYSLEVGLGYRYIRRYEGR